MTDQRKRRKRLSQAETIARKAAKLGEILHCGTPGLAQEQDAAQAEQLERETELQSGPISPQLTRDALKGEIRALRHQLAQKTADYRALLGDAGRSESQVVQRVLELLRKPDGATKATLIAETGAKKGYIDALLNRILPARGHALHSNPVDGARARVYRITTADES
jgi:hypothetical protein